MLRVWSPFVQWWTDEGFARLFGETLPKSGETTMVEFVYKRLYSLQEIRQSFGRMMKKELSELMADGVITEDDYNVIARRLAFKFCAWDLHPPKREEPPPDPVQVKQAIRSRLNGAGAKVMPLGLRRSSVDKLPAPSLEEMLRMHLKPRT